jgi:uncharacterized membrane protein YgdD (TMEM256/DUF423 family)
MNRIALAGALLAGSAVALGAFGAHALRALLDDQQLGWWQTAVQYQLWHALALLALAALRPPRAGIIAWLLGGGASIFSGSLYLMALTGARWLGAITPIGGLAMILGWLLFAWEAGRAPRARVISSQVESPDDSEITANKE